MNDTHLYPDHPSPLSSDHYDNVGLMSWIRRKIRGTKSESNVREAIEELLTDNNQETADSQNKTEESRIDEQERTLITNVLGLAKMRAVDVMIPRADIVAIEINASQDEVIALLGQRPHNRIPVYRETLDEIVGAITIKDILSALAENKPIEIPKMTRDVMIVSPSLPVLDLLLEMQRSKKHMAMVVDEFGGIDGLVAIGDIVEAIVGELDDEDDAQEAPRITPRADGTLVADARVDVDDFENKYSVILSDEEREDIDTLGGLAMAIAGHLPTRGEILRHAPSGLEMEILDADPRRVKRVIIHKWPKAKAVNES